MKKRAFWWFIAVVITLGGTGVAGLQTGQPATQNRRAISPKGEERISREVFHELVMLPRLTIFDHLAYKVDGDTVTLLGQVRTAILKDEAEDAVKEVEGVEHIKNEIEILPISSSDDRIRLAVARAIFSDSRLFRYSLESVPSIHIIVRNGHVALEGAVDNETDKNVAGIKANSVPGIFSVENHLQVQKEPAKK